MTNTAAVKFDVFSRLGAQNFHTYTIVGSKSVMPIHCMFSIQHVQ